MPDRKHTPAFLVLCLIACGCMLPAAVSAEGLGGQWLSSSTSISGQAVVNESATLKMVTYTGGLPEKQEWKFQNTFTSSQRNSWGSNLFLGTREFTPLFQYSRMGPFAPFSFTL